MPINTRSVTFPLPNNTYCTIIIIIISNFKKKKKNKENKHFLRFSRFLFYLFLLAKIISYGMYASLTLQIFSRLYV